MANGFLYLFAVLDWATRRVLAWRLSNTMTTDFCIEAVEEAIEYYGVPLIFKKPPLRRVAARQIRLNGEAARCAGAARRPA